MKPFQLSETDRHILAELSRDGRVPYKVLAERVGLAISTCHARVRALEEHGVIRSYRAEVDPVAAGKLVSALILVAVQGHHRDQVPAIAEEIRSIPGVQQVFLIGGEKDIVVHVSTESVHELRNVLAHHLGSNAALTQTQTQIVFDHFTGTAPFEVGASR